MKRSRLPQASQASLWSALRLRCPYCRSTRLQKPGSWFEFVDGCPPCDYRFEREAGYYTNASWMLNLPITSSLAFLLGTGLYLSPLGWNLQVYAAIVSLFVLGFGAWFFPYSQALWIYFEHKWHPLQEEDRLSQRPQGSGPDRHG